MSVPFVEYIPLHSCFHGQKLNKSQSILVLNIISLTLVNFVPVFCLYSTCFKEFLSSQVQKVPQFHFEGEGGGGQHVS